MVDIMQQIIEESDDISQELLDLIFEQFLETRKVIIIISWRIYSYLIWLEFDLNLFSFHFL